MLIEKLTDNFRNMTIYLLNQSRFCCNIESRLEIFSFRRGFVEEILECLIRRYFKSFGESARITNVMSAAALLGLAIFNAVISEPVKKSMACAIKTQIARINQDASVLAGCESFVGGGSSSHNRILQGSSQFDQKSPYSSLSYEGSNHSPPNLGPLSDGNQQKPPTVGKQAG